MAMANASGVNGPRQRPGRGRNRYTVKNLASKKSSPTLPNRKVSRPSGPKSTTGVSPGPKTPVTASKPSSANTSKPLQTLQLNSAYNTNLAKALSAMVKMQQQLGTPGAQPGPGGGSPAENTALAKRLAARRFGFSGEQWRDLKWLWNRESGFSSTAANPTSSARGIPQAMMSVHFDPDNDNNWMEHRRARKFLRNPRMQILWGLNYILNRYTNPSNARAHSESFGWY